MDDNPLTGLRDRFMTGYSTMDDAERRLVTALASSRAGKDSGIVGKEFVCKVICHGDASSKCDECPWENG
jgi:hypothetical protein